MNLNCYLKYNYLNIENLKHNSLHGKGKGKSIFVLWISLVLNAKCPEEGES